MNPTPQKPWSIRRRLTRRVLGLVSFTWLLTILLATLFIHYEINEMLDEELETMGQTIALSLDASPGQAIPRTQSLATDNDERILRILRAGEEPLAAPWPALKTEGFHQIAGWRVLRLATEGAVIEVAHRMAWRREEVFEAALAFLLLLIPMLILLLWGLRQSLNQGFTPLTQLASQIAARGPADLTPVPLAPLPRELTSLAEGLNSYIARIHDLRQAEQQFVANASHELRTPVAAIRARLNLSCDPEARASLPMLDALTRRVERLLQLARSEAGLGLAQGPADVVQILHLLLREMTPQAPHPLHFDDGDFEEMWLAADPDALAIMLRNLIENALEHGSGPVEIRLRKGQVQIKNPCATAELHEAAFAKRKGSPGLGLGLTIITQLAEAMDITLDKTLEAHAVTVTLRFH